MEIIKLKFLGGVSLALLACDIWSAPTSITLIPKGVVEVRTSEGEPWKSVSSAIPLAPGQQVRTSKESTAELTFTDGSRIALYPGTLFTVEKTDTQETRFSLGLGKIRAVLAGFFSSRVNIKTPTAVAAVRGTAFELEATPEKTEMNVAEGLLEVQDSKGNKAVVTSEETLRVGTAGMEQPQQVSLTDNRAQDAARPMVVRQEMARDQTRAMLEELRNLELKANEAKLGKDVIDAFGNRVRLEEYLLRPAANEFKLLFLSYRSELNRLDWGHLIQRFAKKIPDDLTQTPAIVSGSYFSSTAPKNWIKYFEVYLTNTVDAIKETIDFGNPIAINFSGFGLGTRYYPEYIDYKQILSGPGVPGGSRTQNQLSADWSISNSGLFTWKQFVVNSAGDSVGSASTSLVQLTLDPTKTADVAQGYTSILNDRTGDATIDPTTTSSFPSGITKADFLVETRYRDNSTVSSEKILVSNDGKILDSSTTPNSDSFIKEGSFNLEIVVKSSLFQGRKIDVLFAPEILSQKKEGTPNPGVLTPK